MSFPDVPQEIFEQIARSCSAWGVCQLRLTCKDSEAKASTAQIEKMVNERNWIMNDADLQEASRLARNEKVARRWRALRLHVPRHVPPQDPEGDKFVEEEIRIQKEMHSLHFPDVLLNDLARGGSTNNILFGLSISKDERHEPMHGSPSMDIHSSRLISARYFPHLIKALAASELRCTGFSFIGELWRIRLYWPPEQNVQRAWSSLASLTLTAASWEDRNRLISRRGSRSGLFPGDDGYYLGHIISGLSNLKNLTIGLNETGHVITHS